MARNFDGHFDYAYTDSAVAGTGTKHSMACLVRPDNANPGNSMTAFSMRQSSGSAQAGLYLNKLTGDGAGYYQEDTRGRSVTLKTGSVGGGTWTTNRWYLIGVRIQSNSNRQLVICEMHDLSTYTTASDTATIVAWTAWGGRTAIGALYNYPPLTPSNYFDGDIDWTAYWKGEALGDWEFKAMAMGIPPVRIRPTSLYVGGGVSNGVAWRIHGLTSPEPDYTGRGLPLTLVSAPPRSTAAPCLPLS